MSKKSYDEEQFVHFKDRGDLWNDISPIDEFSNEVNILKIDYSEELKEINDYFRAILKKNEISQRAFDLTTELLERAATNYMGWYHRRLCIDNMDLDLEEELEFLDEIIEENQKNYQIWHHRKAIVEKSQNPSKEKPILNYIFEEEPKNFHAWCHRIWVVRRFNLIESEFEFIDEMLNKDSRNNSAWNYRFFLFTFVNENITKEIFENELKYTLKRILECPNNESSYNYIRGLFQIKSKEEESFLFKFIDFPYLKEHLESVFEKNPKVYHCLALLFDIELENKNKEKCFKIIENLVEIDYIRKKYWLWKKQNLNEI